MNSIAEAEPPIGWRERKRRELQNLIYDAALDRFRAEGFANVTVEQIATAAGIGKGTFFNHFPSKDNVLQEWYRRVTRGALKRVSAQEFSRGRDAVLALCGELTNRITADPVLWEAKCGATSKSLLRKEEEDLDKEVRAFCLREIERDIAAGSSVPSADAEFLADLVLTILTGSGHSWSIAGHSWDLTATTRRRISFVLQSLHAKSGEE